MKKLSIQVVILAVSMLLLMAILPATHVSAEPVLIREPINFTVEPVKIEEVFDVGEEAVEDQIPYNVDMVDAENVEGGGEGIYVAILDTGLLSNYLDFFPESFFDIKEEWGKGFTHDLIWVGSGGNWSEEFDYGPLRDDRGFITHDAGAPDKYNFDWGSGHGTHVTSIVTGYYFERGPVQAMIAGVAPKATIIPVLVLDDWIEFNPDFTEGWFFAGGTNEMVAAGITYIGNLAEEYGIKIIINMSLGGSTPSGLIEEAIDYAISKGVIIVASAGNEGLEGMGWPGAYPQVISTAAAGWTQEYGAGYYDYYWWWNDVPEKLNTNNYVYDPWTGITYTNNWQTYLIDFSSRPNGTLGQSWKDLDVAAPGCAIRGPYKPYYGTQWGYYGVWGTSQAAPHVSGVAALILQSYGWFNQADVEWVLKSAATRIPMPADGAYVSDTFSDFHVWYYWWNDHDAGSGFLTYDESMKSARIYIMMQSRGPKFTPA